ncbi:gene transfer agent family protein [Palleronia caenipelagi]|uniref:Gene transfer agent family protein n=1 Tax=Palleronia caenipelagi TaxID=2489174 RepID=A0A547Q055_9RHOB|nr:gene transfer agent family protein [Palleronia caenipelagi]TRD19764.1 gene transfer agent family protein [Palleronia caenipelagi]
MENPWAGEVAVTVDGVAYRARLTLGALAELEATMEADSLIALVTRFDEGRFATRDVVVLLAAGLRGAGWKGTPEDLLSADIAGGPAEAVRVAGALLARAFVAP